MITRSEVTPSFSDRDNKELEEVKQSLGNLLKELEQIRATLTVHIDVGYGLHLYSLELIYCLTVSFWLDEARVKSLK